MRLQFNSTLQNCKCFHTVTPWIKPADMIWMQYVIRNKHQARCPHFGLLALYTYRCSSSSITVQNPQKDKVPKWIILENPPNPTPTFTTIGNTQKNSNLHDQFLLCLNSVITVRRVLSYSSKYRKCSTASKQDLYRFQKRTI